MTFTNVPESIVATFEKNIEKLCSLENAVLEPATINFISVRTYGGDVELPTINWSNENKVVKKGHCIGEKILSIEKAKKLEVRKSEIKPEQIIVDELVTEEQKAELVGILNKYRECVAFDESELGCTTFLEMDIEVEEGAQPVWAKPYRSNAKDREDLDKLITVYKDTGLASETNSEYASPCFIVRKKDGTPRMVVDYRPVYKQTKKLSFPIPNFDDMIEKLNGANLFITLDLAQGYLQVPLTERAKEKTAFISETQTGQFERAMFGLVNAPIYFAKIMYIVLGKAIRKGTAFTFFDDTCIFAATWELLMIF